MPTKIIDASMKISSVSTTDLTPYIPDYFHEDISTPANLNFSFVPASPTETEWRADFYDQYTEWDRLDIGSHDPRTSPRTTIDMFLDVANVPLVSNTGVLTHRVPRSLRSVADP
jgi:hypothetical protein